MGWRDVQAGVASGDISYKPEKDVFGSFASGALGGAIKKRDKEREEAIVAEKERKEQEKITLKATENQDKLEKKWKNQALHVMKSIGLQGGANSPDYLDIFTSISSGISQSDVLTGLNTQITDSRRTIGENGQFTKAAAPVTAPSSYPRVADMHTLTNEDLQRLSQDPGAPADVAAQAVRLIKAVNDTPTSTDMSGWTVQRIKSARVNTTDPAVLAEMDALIIEKDSQNTAQVDADAEQKATDATDAATTEATALYADAAILKATPETLLRMRLMAPPERHAAIDAAIAGLKPDQSAQARYSTMSADDLAVSLALATEATEVALIKKAITARGTIIADVDLPKVENVRYDNYKAYALAATNAGDAALASQITTLGEDMVKTKADATGVKLQTGSDSYITTYVDDAGELQTTNTVLTQSGSHFSTDLGKVVELMPNSTPLNIERTGDLYKQFIQIKTSTIIPLETKRKELMATLSSAERLKEIVSRNPAVLTTVGSGVKALSGLGVEAETIVSMFESDASSSAVLSYIDSKATEAQSIKGVAKDVALYQAELLKFAYTYAASGLGQSGQGLSDTDFKNAINIVSKGSRPDTFLDNLHFRVEESIKSTNTVINDFTSSTEVDILSSLSGDLLDSYKRTAEQYAADNGSSDIFAWGNAPYVAGPTPAANASTAPAGSMLITQAMVNTTPGLGKYLGKIVYKENGKLVVWSK